MNMDEQTAATLIDRFLSANDMLDVFILALRDEVDDVNHCLQDTGKMRIIKRAAKHARKMMLEKMAKDALNG